MSMLAFAVGILALATGAVGLFRRALQPSEDELLTLVGDSSEHSHTTVRKTCDPSFTFPDHSLSLLASKGGVQGQTLTSEIQLEEREYTHNFSHVHECPGTDANVTMMFPLVLPEYKLAFCHLSKVGSTQFKDLFNTINGISNNNTLGFGMGPIESSYFVQNISMSEMTREKGWRFAAFTRDPALRYLSAFGDTCIDHPDLDLPHRAHLRSCCGPLVNGSLPKEELVRRFKARLEMDLERGNAKQEDHWAQQVQFLNNCGWDKFKPGHLDFWGVLSGDIHAQVMEMLNLVGYVNATVVSTVFPEQGAAGHHGHLQGEPLDYYNDLKSLEAIMTLYEEDYRYLPGIGCSFTEPLLAHLTANRSGESS